MVQRNSGNFDVAIKLGEVKNHKSWYDRATVRRSPRRRIERLEPLQGMPFSRQLVPLIKHPVVTRYDESMAFRILARALGDHLRFIEDLENQVILPISQRIQTGEIFQWTTKKMRLDAGRIAVDEAYHSLFSCDMRYDLESILDIDVPPRPASSLMRLQTLEADTPPEKRWMIRTFFTIVSEIVVSGVLREVPNDKSVAQPVRELIADHLRDEVWHQWYYSSIFAQAWDELSVTEKDFIGPKLAAFTQWFFEPNYAAIEGWLIAENFKESQVTQIINDLKEVGEHKVQRTKGTVQLMKVLCEGGALAHEKTAYAFESLN